MTLVAADRVLETSTTSGTGAYALAGAVAGFRTISSIPGLANGDTIDLGIHGFDMLGAATGDYETGTYTWNTGGTLTRTTIRSSSNGGAAVNWPAMGTRQIAGSLLAYDLTRLRGLIPNAPRNPYAPDAYSLIALPPGIGRADTTPYGGIVTALGVRATNLLNPAFQANVFLSDKVVNGSPASKIDAILNSANTDDFGPYVAADGNEVDVGQVRNVQSMDQSDIFTLLILARITSGNGQAVVRFFDGGSGRVPTFTLNATVPGGNEVTFAGDTAAPKYYYVSMKRSEATLATYYQVLVKYMRVYGLWAVEGTLPVVTSRDKDRAGFAGVPGYMTGDYLWSQVVVGQSYRAIIPGITEPLLKTATEGLVYKWGQEQKKARLYKVENRTVHPVLLLTGTLASGAALTYDAATGTESYTVATGSVVTGSPVGLSVSLAAAVNGEQYTIALRNSADYDTMLLTLSNSAGANVVYLQLDGTWATTSAELAGGKDGSKYPANVAITFTMPTGTIATNLGSAPKVVLRYVGPNSRYTPATMVRGASACF